MHVSICGRYVNMKSVELKQSGRTWWESDIFALTSSFIYVLKWGRLQPPRRSTQISCFQHFSGHLRHFLYVLHYLFTETVCIELSHFAFSPQPVESAWKQVDGKKHLTSLWLKEQIDVLVIFNQEHQNVTVRICCFSLVFLTVIWISFGLRLLLQQNMQLFPLIFILADIWICKSRKIINGLINNDKNDSQLSWMSFGLQWECGRIWSRR